MNEHACRRLVQHVWGEGIARLGNRSRSVDFTGLIATWRQAKVHAETRRVQKNAAVFFTIFQTFMTGTDGSGEPVPYFGDYPPDFFNLVNRMQANPDPDYCVRVTANDGVRGEQDCAKFHDNEKTVPTMLTTSQKLSTGVDARNGRNIVLMRPVNSMIEIKQIIGHGTRLCEGKGYFTIFDFVKAYEYFNDPEWDGEPIEPEALAPGLRRARGPKAATDRTTLSFHMTSTIAASQERRERSSSS